MCLQMASFLYSAAWVIYAVPGWQVGSSFNPQIPIVFQSRQPCIMWGKHAPVRRVNSKCDLWRAIAAVSVVFRAVMCPRRRRVSEEGGERIK